MSKTQIKSQIRKLNRQLQKLNQAEFEKKYRPKLKALVGSCWKFHNSSSGSEKWWLYIRITGLLDGCLESIRIEKMSHGMIQIETATEYPNSDYSGLGERHIRITQEEFDAGTKPTLDEVANLLKP